MKDINIDNEKVNLYLSKDELGPLINGLNEETYIYIYDICNSSAPLLRRDI